MAFKKETDRYAKAIVKYIFKSNYFEVNLCKKISIAALEQLTDELDRIIRFICDQLTWEAAWDASVQKYVNTNKIVLTKLMVTSRFPLPTYLDNVRYKNKVLLTSIFKKDHLKGLILKNTGFAAITDAAYFQILKCIHKRLDDIITMSINITTGLTKPDDDAYKIKSKAVEVSAECMRVCLYEFE